MKKILSAGLVHGSGGILEYFDEIAWDYSEEWDGDVMGFVENLISIYELEDICYASTQAGAYEELISNDIGEAYLVRIENDYPEELFWVDEDWREDDEDV